MCPALRHTLTLLGHPHREALLQPAVLATVPGDLVDDAVPVAVARVGHVLLHAAAEEALCKEIMVTGNVWKLGDKLKVELN